MTFIMPIVIFIYGLLITVSILLLVRCLTSQNNYVIAFRAARFTDADNQYGEVIYNERKNNAFDRQGYVYLRLQKVASRYPVFTQTDHCFEEGEKSVRIQTKGFQNECEKETAVINPVEKVREERRK